MEIFYEVVSIVGYSVVCLIMVFFAIICVLRLIDEIKEMLS